ncbi:MAG: hypothetical protein L0Y61_02470 [Epsilonproteobacteria bacterium]|nr:hypothetical protein [Campylobacterota bacterium]
MDSVAPYGLNKAEKAILLNNEKINAISSKIDSFESKLGSIESKQNDLSQRIEGVKSVYESESQNIHNTKLVAKTNENKIEEQTGLLSVKIGENSKKIENLSAKLDDFINLQKKNNKLLEDSNQKLLTIINKINTEYVSKSQFEELVAFINKNSPEQAITHVVVPKKQENLVLESTEKQKVNKNDKKQNIDNKDLFDEGLKLFKSNQTLKAMPIFEQLVTSKYKPAESNFYLAETKFIKKEYKEAIQSYKQSMIANDQAEYIPKLLLHSALSFENLEQKENATNFYKTIIDVYPNSKEAKEAIKKLKLSEDVSANTKESKEKSSKNSKKEKEEKKKSKKSKDDIKEDKKEKKKSNKEKSSKDSKKEKEEKKKPKKSKDDIKEDNKETKKKEKND